MADGARKLVGRESEVAVLETRLAEAGEGSMRVVLLAGSAGVGKSVLLETFVAGAESTGAAVLEAVCERTGGDSRFVEGLIRGARAAAGAAAPQEQPATDARPNLTGAGAGPGSLSKDRVQELHITLRDLAGTRTVALLVDRAELASAGLCEALGETVRALSDQRMLLLLATVWPLPAEAPLAVLLRHLRLQGVLTEMVLGPLDRPASDRLVRETAGEVPAPQPFLEAVHSLARGNPRLVVEIVGAAMAHAAPRGIRLDEVDLAGLPATPALVERFRGAIGTLFEEEKRILEIGSAIGPRFGIGAVTAASGLPGGTVERHLAHLVRSGTLVELDPERRAFALPQLATMLYDSLTEDSRRDIHARLASVLGPVAESHDSRYLSELGRHLALAGDYASAYAAYGAAAQRAEEIGDDEGALKGYGLALKVLRAGSAPPDKETELGLLNRMTALEARLGLNEEAQRHLRDAVGIARRLGRKHDEAESLLGLGYALRASAKVGQAVDEFTAACAVAEEAGAAGIVAEAHRGIASCRYKTGDFPDALQELQLSLGVKLEPEDHVLRGRTHALAGSVFGVLGRFREAEAAYEDALRHLGSRDPRESAHVRRLMAEVLLYEGEFARSLEVAERAQRDAEACGSETVASVARVLQCEALVAMGRTAEGETRLNSVLMSRPRHGLAAQSLTALVRGGLSTALGRYDEALAHLGAALERARAAGNIVYEAEAHYRTAILYHYMGLEVRKRDTLQAALSIFKRMGNGHRTEQCRLWMRAAPIQPERRDDPRSER